MATKTMIDQAERDKRAVAKLFPWAGKMAPEPDDETEVPPHLVNVFPRCPHPDALLWMRLTAEEHRQLCLLSNSASMNVAGMTAYFCGDKLRGLLRTVLARVEDDHPTTGKMDDDAMGTVLSLARARAKALDEMASEATDDGLQNEAQERKAEADGAWDAIATFEAAGAIAKTTVEPPA